MKTTVKELDYEKVMALPQYPHLHPIRPGIFWRTLVRGLSILGLAGTHFHYTSEGMEKVGKNEPCLILMNHSCFLDLQIASTILYPRPYNIICTSDGFVGMGGLMAWAMRTIGCVPTRKFVTDLTAGAGYGLLPERPEKQRSHVPGSQLFLRWHLHALPRKWACC